MEAKTKFLIVYALLAVLAVVAAGTGYETVKLKQKVDKIPVPLTVEQKVESAISAQYAAYFTSKNIPAKVDDAKSVCIKSNPTTVTCKIHLVNTSTGKTLDQKLVATWNGTAVTKVVAAK